MTMGKNTLSSETLSEPYLPNNDNNKTWIEMEYVIFNFPKKKRSYKRVAKTQFYNNF